MIPTIWKKSNILLIPKNGDASNPDNYRGISRACSISKIMERDIAKDLNLFLTCHKILPDCQHGFRSRKSVTTQMTEFLDFVTKTRDRGKTVFTIYFDIAKAFDTVNHCILIEKFLKIGLSTPKINWFVSFLKNRTFWVLIDDSSSATFPVPNGVPQGTVLVPSCFQFSYLIYQSFAKRQVSLSLCSQTVLKYAQLTQLLCNLLLIN